MADRPINAKVPWSAAGAGGATGVSFAFSDLFITLFKSMGWAMTDTNITSVQIIVAAICAAIGSYLVGYMKDSGFTAEQQAQELKITKAREKE